MNGTPLGRRRRTPASRRIQLLAAFERSGFSAAAFARRHGLGYTTFCGWRHRGAKAKPSPAFVEIEVPEPGAAVELLIEVGARARLRLTFRWPQCAGESKAKLRLAPQALQLLLDGVDLKDGARRAWYEAAS